MKKLAMIAALLLATSPVEAQVATSNGQELSGGQIGQSAASQAPTTGVICEEEMTATFCNVVSVGRGAHGWGAAGRRLEGVLTRIPSAGNGIGRYVPAARNVPSR